MLAQPRPAQPVLALNLMYTFRIGRSQARAVNNTRNEEKQRMLPSGPSTVVKPAADHPEQKAAMEASFPGQELCGRRQRQKQSR